MRHGAGSPKRRVAEPTAHRYAAYGTSRQDAPAQSIALARKRPQGARQYAAAQNYHDTTVCKAPRIHLPAACHARRYSKTPAAG